MQEERSVGRRRKDDHRPPTTDHRAEPYTGVVGRRSSVVAPLAALALLAALFLGRQLYFGLSLVPFDLLPGTAPWRFYPHGGSPPWNPLLDSLQQYYPRRVLFDESLRAGYL